LTGKTLIVTSPGISKHYGQLVKNSLEQAGYSTVTLNLPAGEHYKTSKTIDMIYSTLLKNRFERSSTILALGGGVLGDMAGFAAATYQRGIPFVQIPTTLLAMVDSSVGGKTGYNHALGKNMIGAFYQPKFVLIDTQTLKTLPARELWSGLAEVLKYGFILDERFYQYCEKMLLKFGTKCPEPVLIKLIKRSCELKAWVVSKDEKESGLRAILNFGHTIGHAIETVTKYTKYTHGEAVALGMLYALKLSSLPTDKIKKLYTHIGLPTTLNKVSATALLNAMKLDKKVAQGQIRMILLKRIGKAYIQKITTEELKTIL
jgi:3-dehydroquinate synthase